MPLDPNSIKPGKSYLTATNHVRSVLEVTEERIRYAHGSDDSGGVRQWRWQTKAKFANDVVKEIEPEVAPESTPQGETPKVEKPEPRRTGSRPLLSKPKK